MDDVIVEFLRLHGEPSKGFRFLCKGCLKKETRLNGEIYYLYQEHCSRNANECWDGLDRLGLCCFILDGAEKMLKVRRASYPW